MDDMCLVYNINLCRICQIPKNLMLEDTSTTTKHGESYLDLLKFIFKDISWIEDRRISLICQFCIKKIKDIAAFKTICLESNNRRGALPLNVDIIKFEVEEVEIDEIPELKEVFDEYDNEQSDSEDENQWKKRRHLDDFDEEQPTTKKVKNEMSKSDDSMRLRNRKELLHYDEDSDEERRNLKAGSFECPICHMCFERTRTLDRHVFKHTGVRTYICNDCNSKFITHYDLQSHRLRNCSKASDNVDEIKVEKQPRSKKRRKFVCNICHQVFGGAKPLERHVFKHNGIRKHTCDGCGMKFITGDDMKNHIQNHCKKYNPHRKRGPKPKPPKYVCDICNKRFDAKAALERHVYKHNGSRNHSCEGCGMQFITANDLKLHTRKHCNKGDPGKKRGPKPRAPRFVCDICNMVFDGLKPLERHVYRHNGSRNYVCNGCGTKFITGDDLKGHVLRHCNGIKKEKLTISGNHYSKIRKYSCDLCPTDFDRLTNLERHVYQHNGIRNYTCNGCNTKFITREDLKGHLRRHCTEEKLSCFLCPDKQFTPITLEVHMKMIHMIGMDGKSALESSVDAKECKDGADIKKEDAGVEDVDKKTEEEKKTKDAKTFKCHYCPMEFTRLKHLDRHIYNHDGTRNYICNDCGTRSITIDNLRSHMRVVHANKEDFKFLCTECGARFPQSSGLKLHVNRVHSNIRDFNCDICFKGFCVKRDLRNHMTSHSDVREFKCDLCPAQYKRKDVLLIHKTKRHGIGNYKCQDEKKHECSFCDKKFNVREKLNRHIRSHTGVKPFKCRLCDMKFTCKSYIKGHVMSKHSDLVDEHDFEVNIYCEVLEDLVTTNSTLSLKLK